MIKERACVEADQYPARNALADEISALALTRFIDAEGQLHKFFGDIWVLAEGVDCRPVKPDHQFELASLLERWARLLGRDDAHREALRLFDAAEGRGRDAKRDVAIQQLLADGSVHDDVTCLWPQTKRTKAAVILGEDEEMPKAVRGRSSTSASRSRACGGTRFAPTEASSRSLPPPLFTITSSAPLLSYAPALASDRPIQ